MGKVTFAAQRYVETRGFRHTMLQKYDITRFFRHLLFSIVPVLCGLQRLPFPPLLFSSLSPVSRRRAIMTEMPRGFVKMPIKNT